MDIKQALTQIGSDIASVTAPQAVTKNMTQEQFIAYANDEIAKAKACDDPEMKKKRLDALSKVVADLQKSSWEGTNEKVIPVFVDPGQQQPTEQSGTMTGGNGTQADGQSFAAAGGAQSFAKLDQALEGLKAPPPAGTGTVTKAAPVKDDHVWPTNMSNPEYMKEGVAKRGGDWGTDDAKAPTK